MKLHACIICLLIFVPASFSQQLDYYFDHLDIDDGLSNNTVLSITRDHLGFVWFGTNDGLTRYDGYDHIVYRHDRDDSTTISNNKIYHVMEDSRGDLWIATSHGLNLYQRERDSFRRFLHDPADHSSISHNMIRTIYEDENGTLWFGTLGGGLNKYDRERDQFSRYNFPDRYISSILEDSDGQFWIGTSAPGLILFNRAGNDFSYYPFPVYEEHGLKPQTGKTIYEDPMGNIWVCTEGAGLYQFDKQKKTFTNHYFNCGGNGLNSDIISDIFYHADGTYWIATDGGGINIFHPETNAFHQIRSMIADNSSLSSDAVYTFLSDHEGIIWIGTFGGGVNVLNPNQQEFQYFTQKAANPESLSHRSVLSFFEDSRDNVWVGTDGGGLNLFDRESGTFEHFRHDPANHGSLSANAVTCITEDSGGMLWVGTFAGGLNRFDPETKRFQRFTYRPEDSLSIGSNNVWKLLEDREKYLWVGTLDGLERYDPDKQVFDKVPVTERYGDPFPTRILSLFEDSRGQIWVGSKGLAILNRYNLTYSFIRDKDDKISALFGYDIRDFFEDVNGHIWIASEGAGLFRYDPVALELRNFTVRDGLPSDAIHQIVQDDSGNIWLSSNKGISRMDPETLTFRNYDVNDGLQSNQFAYSASLISRSGEVYFGGVNGFNIFHPERIKENTTPPKVYITDFSLFNEPVEIGGEDSPLSSHIMQTREITLPYRSVFTFRFTAINYIATQKNQYCYKLEGFDDWNDVGGQRMATYTNISPGRYTFRVIASNNDGFWNEEGAYVSITILPPFWRTYYAYVLYVVVFFTLMYFIFKYVLNRQRYKHDLMIKDLEKARIEEINQMKLRFFTNIAHEFRTPLTLIVGPLDKLMNSDMPVSSPVKKQLNIMGRSAGRLLRLINELMDFRKMELGRIKLHVVRADLVAFVYDVKTVFDEHARQHSIEYVFRYEKEIIETWFDKEKVEKVIYNILSNAFKFTPDYGKVVVEVKYAEPSRQSKKNGAPSAYAEIVVSDNGAGIPPEELNRIFDRFYQVKGSNPHAWSDGTAGTGIGLALARELTEFHKGEIRAESSVGAGSVFRVLLPIGKDHLDPDLVVESSRDEYTYQYSGGFYGTIPALQIASENSMQKDTGLSASIKKPTLLFVDDNPDMLTYIKSSLEEGYKIHLASNGIEGLENALKVLPDIIVSDVMMPGMDGIEMCRRIKSDMNTSHLPVILLTAKFSDDHTIEGFDAGADDYIAKPFNLRVLHSRIRNILDIREQLRARFRKEGILQPGEVTVTSADEQFLRKAMEVVEKYMADPDFRVGTFVSEMNMSRSVLYRKFEALTGQSVNEFVKNIRLKRAAQLLELNELNISEVTYEVGFSDPQYFSKCFGRHYGMTPSEYARKHVKTRSSSL